MNASYSHGVSTRALIGKTLGDVLDEVAVEFAANEALVSVFENQRFTYARFRDEVNRCARAMMALGVQKGDRVGIWSTNCLAWVLAQFATAKLGVILVNINPAYRTHELEFALKHSECSVLISGEGFRDADYAAMLHQLVPELASADPHQDLRSEKYPQLRRLVFLGDRPKTGFLNWNELLSWAERVAPWKHRRASWPQRRDPFASQQARQLRKQRLRFAQRRRLASAD